MKYVFISLLCHLLVLCFALTIDQMDIQSKPQVNFLGTILRDSDLSALSTEVANQQQALITNIPHLSADNFAPSETEQFVEVSKPSAEFMIYPKTDSAFVSDKIDDTPVLTDELADIGVELSDVERVPMGIK